MASEPPAASENWPLLRLAECRVLGVMVEKAKTTPDAYPMSVNALVTGCNQKSNRDPVLNLSEEEVEETLDSLQARGLATKILGGRVVRWKHNLYEAWQVEKVDLAVLAELMLRGPQTEGELRSRAGRMEPIDDLDELRAVLRPLATRGLVVLLGPEGRRGTLITHGFHDPRELEALKRQSRADEAPSHATAGPVLTPPPPDQLATLENTVQEVRAEVTSLREQLQQMQEALAKVTQQLQSLKESLGA
jgi:uncharacterized protein YceH (UPF0502 family)